MSVAVSDYNNKRPNMYTHINLFTRRAIQNFLNIYYSFTTTLFYIHFAIDWTFMYVKKLKNDIILFIIYDYNTL